MSAQRMTSPDVAVVWLELFRDHDPAILMSAAKFVCYREEFPSVAALSRHYRRLAIQAGDEVARLSAGEDVEREDMPTNEEISGYVEQLKRVTRGETLDDEGESPYTDLGYERR